MSLYEIMQKNLDVAEQIGQIKEIHMREKTEYMPEGFSVKGETRDGKDFHMEFYVEDIEENRAEELELGVKSDAG